ncbi:MAG: glycosyltransferase, partial [Vulcanimicrobiaceae bacterium]
MLLSALRLAALGGIAYLGFALFRVTTYRRSRTNAGALAPPLTLLKPLCGLEPQLYENLCSFCDQEYPEFQVVFSAADAHDPALEVARAVASRFAGRDITVSADAASTRASNPKIANLLGAMPHAKHDILVVADSDMRVGRGYLAAVAGTFASASIGAATCLYRGRAAGGFAAALGAAFV